MGGQRDGLAGIGYFGKTSVKIIVAPVHTSRLVQSHFNENNIFILAWPARSPELNIIENFWVELVHGVYANGK